MSKDLSNFISMILLILSVTLIFIAIACTKHEISFLYLSLVLVYLAYGFRS